MRRLDRDAHTTGYAACPDGYAGGLTLLDYGRDERDLNVDLRQRCIGFD
jgi:hypothetical protein